MKKQALCLPGIHFLPSKGNQVMVFDKTNEVGGGSSFALSIKISSCLSPAEQADLLVQECIAL